MRMRRVGHGFGGIVIPAVCFAVSAYFAHNFLFGERGLIAWHDTQYDLAVAQRDLAALRAKREALQHRIALIDGKSAIDPDLLEEVARGVLLESRPGEVAVPRERR